MQSATWHFIQIELMGGVRRQTHWENAREQGLVAGANMTGKKRIRYEQIPYFWTEMFDLRMDFVGDFSVLPTRVDLRGHLREEKIYRALLSRGQTPRHSALSANAARGGFSQDAVAQRTRQIRWPVATRKLMR